MKQPIHLEGTGKLDHELIDNAVVTDRAGDGPLPFESGHRQFVGRMWTVESLGRQIEIEPRKSFKARRVVE